MEVVSFLLYPFLGCVLLILIHAYFGIHILERGIIFVDLSLAQFIAMGIALSFLLGHDEGSGKTIYAIAFAILGASILSLSRFIRDVVNLEAFIGALYIFSLASSFLVLDRTPHGLEEFRTILNGNILWVTPGLLLKTFLLYAVIGILHWAFRKRFFSLTFDGIGSWFWEFLFFLSFAFVLVSSVQIAGVLQVFSFLVIPALIGRLYTRDPVRILVGGWVIGLVASLFGIAMSYKFDLPTAPLIVASLSVVFIALLALSMARKWGSRGQI
jgi:zinc/manganese transport system permease protein